MSKFARVEGGVVQEVLVADELPPFHPTVAAQWHPAPDNVQPTWTYNGSAYAAPGAAPANHLGDFYGLIGAGVTITSTGTPALNGTYAVDDQTQLKIIGLLARIANGLGFPPGNSATLDYGDVQGNVHTFTETAFKNLAVALGDFVLAATGVLQSRLNGGNDAWPSPNVTIA